MCDRDVAVLEYNCMRDKNEIQPLINVLIYRLIKFNINLLIFDKTKTVIMSK